MTVDERLEHIEAMLTQLVERQAVKDFYTPEEFARIVQRADFTCREWCRHGRIHAKKKCSGRGAHAAWAISHEELQRYQREGLLNYRPVRRNQIDNAGGVLTLIESEGETHDP